MSGVARARRWWRVGVAAGLLGLSAGGVLVAQGASTVKAVLFFSPTCPHCHDVMTRDLPPLVQKYGDRLQIVTISTMTETGERLYLATVEHFAIPPERQGVPALIVGNTVLVGSGEIPGQFPRIVEAALAGAGLDWPAVPAIRAELEAQGLIRPAAPPVTVPAAGESPAARPAPSSLGAPASPRSAEAGAGVDGSAAAAAPAGDPADPGAAAADSADQGAAAGAPPSPPAEGVAVLGAGGAPAAGMMDRFWVDPVANGVAVAVLGAMLLAVVMVLRAVAVGRAWWRPLPSWLPVLLALVGLGVAAYLAFVEVTQAVAVCGPVGDCNTVQQSPYARLAGVPIGVLGVVGYVGLLGTWLLGAHGPADARPAARWLFWAGALAGTLFSVYLTFLEPFVIGATCAWCVTSALIMTVLLLGATPRALEVRRQPAPVSPG